MSKYSRILYNSIKLDFDRGLTAFSPFPIQEKSINFSANGRSETLNYYRYWNFAFARQHAHADLKNQLTAFWDYVRSGNSFAFWHDRDLGGYWTFEGKSLKSIDEVDGTFTRATAAFYAEPTTGLLEEIDTGIVRYPAGKFGRGILIERAATNIAIKSTEFNDAAWNAASIMVTTNTGVTKAPAGGSWATTADLAELTASTGTFTQDTSTNIGTTNGVFSVYLRHMGAGTKSGTLYIKRVDTDATLASQPITITTAWQRFTVAYTNGGSITADWRMKIELTGSSGDKFAVWGGQFEAAASITTPSTFYPTTTIAGTRNAEILSYGASNFFDDEPTQGSICFWYAVHPSADSNLSRELLLLQKITSGNLIEVAQLSGETVSVAIAQKNGSTVSFTTSGQAGSDGNFHHYAITWDSTIANGVKVYSDGALIGGSTNSAFAIARLGTNFYLGSDGSGNNADGIFDDLLIRKDVLTAQEIAEIALSTLPLGYDRNYWSALMIEERQFTQNRLPGVSLWDIEIPVREVIS